MAEKTPEQLKKEAEEKRQEEQRKREAEQKKREQESGVKHAGSQRGGGTVPGAMGTYGGGASIPAEPFKPEDHAFTHDEVKGLAGDVQRGELARIELDEEGTPTGVAFRGIPPKDTPVAPVAGTPMVQFDDLVTPSGAPITKHMNPEPTLWDAGMLARNPPPEPDERQQKYYRQGGGVINQPVAS